MEPYLEERERLDAQWQALDVARGLDRLDRAYWRRVWEEREAETRQGTRELADGWVELLEARSRLVEERRRFEEERRVLRRAVRVVWVERISTVLVPLAMALAMRRSRLYR